MPTPTPPCQFIAIARAIARGFTKQAVGRPGGEALTEAARAIWRGIEVLEGMDRHERPGVARTAAPQERAALELQSQTLSVARRPAGMWSRAMWSGHRRGVPTFQIEKMAHREPVARFVRPVNH